MTPFLIFSLVACGTKRTYAKKESLASLECLWVAVELCLGGIGCWVLYGLVGSVPAQMCAAD